MNVRSLGEWRFGADIMDLYRFILVSLQANKASEKMIKQVNEGLGTKIDKLQNVLDGTIFCSKFTSLRQIVR